MEEWLKNDPLDLVLRIIPLLFSKTEKADASEIFLLGIPDTPVEEPPRDPSIPTQENTNGGDQSPKPDRSNSNNNQDPNQVPKSPKQNR